MEFFIRAFVDKIKAVLKDLLSSDKNTRFYVKIRFQLLNIPSLVSHDVLVPVNGKEVCLILLVYTLYK